MAGRACSGGDETGSWQRQDELVAAATAGGFAVATVSGPVRDDGGGGSSLRRRWDGLARRVHGGDSRAGSRRQCRGRFMAAAAAGRTREVASGPVCGGGGEMVAGGGEEACGEGREMATTWVGFGSGLGIE